MLLLTAGAGLAVAEGRLHSERTAAGALRPARATFIVRISRSQSWVLHNWAQVTGWLLHSGPLHVPSPHGVLSFFFKKCSHL